MTKQSWDEGSTCGIYGIRQVSTGRLYIGCSRSIEWRWADHRRHLNWGSHSNHDLQSAWTKEGEIGFELVVLETCNKDELYTRERFWINSTTSTFNQKFSTDVEQVEPQWERTWEEKFGIEKAQARRFEIRKKRMSRLVAELLSFLEVDLNDPNFAETPRRVVEYLDEFRPPVESVSEVLKATFQENHNELVIVRDIDFVSLCSHHLLPFVGTASVGYIPNGEVVGLSKLARLVHHFAHRPTLQERITSQIADALYDELHPQGVGVVLTSKHGCMTLRGVKSYESTTVTSAMRGIMLTNQDSCRSEFLELIRK